MVGCGSPHQHDSFLPDLLGLDGLLVLATRGSDAESRAGGGGEEVKTEWEWRENCEVPSKWKREAEEKSHVAERQKHTLSKK